MEQIGAGQFKGFSGRITATCADCGQEFEGTAAHVVKAFVGFNHRTLCDECQSKAARQFMLEEEQRLLKHRAYWRDKWLSETIPPLYQGKTFENFDAKGNSPRVDAIRQWASDFPLDKPPLGYRSLLLCSRNNGNGKTHLVCAVLHDLISRFNEMGFERCPLQFWTAGDVKRRIYDAQKFSNKEGLSDVYRYFATVRLLVLDDVGKERLAPGEAAAVYEMYYNIINDRYNHRLPIVITSNLSLDTPWEKGGLTLVDIVGLSGVDRLKEMTGGKEYVIEGVSRR